MKKMTVRYIFIGLLTFSGFVCFSPISAQSIKNKHTAVTHEETRRHIPFLSSFSHRLHQIWNEGNNELYISGYAWHNRFIYASEHLKKKEYNELAWGGGLGKGFFDEKGNWHGLYAFAFLDSHRNLEPTTGYAYLKIAHFSPNFKAGVGFSVFVTSRPDIWHSIPFPGAVPWAGVFYKNVSLKSAYIPGTSTNGNVLYVAGTYSFDCW